jgi:hypothetical protein
MDEFYREQRSGPGRQLLDLVCVALLGLILTLAAGAISRAPAAAAAPGTHGKAAADCDTPAKPEPAIAAALPMGAAIAPCGDGTTPAAQTPATQPPAAPPAH